MTQTSDSPINLDKPRPFPKWDLNRYEELVVLSQYMLGVNKSRAKIAVDSDVQLVTRPELDPLWKALHPGLSIIDERIGEEGDMAQKKP